MYMNLAPFIRDIPDFPRKGIVFKDITPLLKDKKAFSFAIEKFFEYCRTKELFPDLVVSPESRGFIFGAALALKLGTGFVPVRKAGKLPGKTTKAEYELEYGKNILEIQEDSLAKNQKIIIVDDLLATGGTVLAVKDLVERLGGTILGFLFLIELTEFRGREKLKGYDVFSILRFNC